MKNKRYLIATIIVSALAVSLNFFIILHSCLNGDASSQASGPVVELFKSIINLFHAGTINDSNIGTFTQVIRKLVGHFGLFLVDGVFTSWSIYLASAYIKKYKQWYGLIFTLFFGLFMAGLSEFIQIFVPGRSGELLDILIDYGGYLLGTGTIVLIAFLRYKKTKD